MDTLNPAESPNLFGNINHLWIIISAALVFFMQAGFKVLETGLVKKEHRAGIGIKNLLDWVAGSLAFFLLGFGLMFGDSAGGVIGTDLFVGRSFDDPYFYVFFIFQLAFAGTALTIVSGAMSGRTALLPYFIASIFTAIIVYPVFGHWAWGNLLITENKSWLADLGFMDFAGSTVVHSVGAWVGLVGIWMVGPRLGRYTAKGVIQPVQASDYAYSILGLMILWLGWWGFNGGSTLAFNGEVVVVILNTNLAAAAACFSAYIHVKVFQSGEDIIEKIIGGALTGLVAITACCNVVTPLSSIVIGLLAGIVHNLSYVLISKKWKLDDPVGAIPVHGFGGVLGTLCVAVFGQEELLVHGRWLQLVIQLFGIAVCLIFTTGISFLVFTTVKHFFGLRLSPKQELEGSIFAAAEPVMQLDDFPEQTVSQVSVRTGDRAYNLFKVNEYLGLPRETRVDLVKNQRVEYLDDFGNVVPTLKAVRYLAGVLEGQRDQAVTEKDLVELSIYNDKMDVIGNMQDVLLGEQYSIVSIFPDSFIMLQSKDQISTDFYWHGSEKGYQIAVAASSCDQGVSNAFISALTISQLNEIVGLKKIVPPEKILAALSLKLQLAMQQTRSNTTDKRGLQIGVFVADTANKKAYYAGSGNGIKMYHKKQGSDLVEYKGLDLPLGGFDKGEKRLERITISYSAGDAFFMCSEGFANQLNKAGKRYSTTKLRNLLAQNASMSMLKQKLFLVEELDEWKGKEDLVSDILIVGIKP
ncbi:MAG: SpoIIE family protein phosphatase [Cyclobacteriaceae bacterium]|nr:SpoIIE family protein phosphatase [Cyclobacteriaceae bacterium HetDA_MAG_MS6]